MKKRWLDLLKIAIGVGILLALFASGKIDFSLFARVQHHWQYFALAQCLFLCAFLATVIRWKLVLRAFEVPSRLGDVIRLGWIGLLFSQAIPGSTGGDVVKGVYIAQGETPNRRAEAVLSVVLDRVIGLTALMLVGGVALVFNTKLVIADARLQFMVWVLVGTAAIVVLAGALLCWERFWRQAWLQRLATRLPGRQILARLANALWTVRGKRKLLFLSLFGSIGIHSLNICCQLLLATALLGQMPSVAAYFFAVPVGQLAFALPLSPGGLGVGEAAYDQIFGLMDLTNGVEVALLVRCTSVMWAIPGLYFYFRGKKDLQKALLQAEEDSTSVAREVEDEREKVAAAE